MDIAKIRKKAQFKDKEKKIAEQKASAPEEMEIKTEIKEEKTEIYDKQQETPAPVAIEDKAEIISNEQKAEERAKDNENGDGADRRDDLLELLTFSLSKEEFAFRVSSVEEIVRFQKINKVPTMPDYVIGITSLRGKIIPVIDLKTRLNLKIKKYNAGDSVTQIAEKSEINEKILIVSGPKGLIGATIDKVLGVIRLPYKEVLDPPSHLTESELKFVEGVVIFEKRFISIIRSEDTMNIEVS